MSSSLCSQPHLSSLTKQPENKKEEWNMNTTVTLIESDEGQSERKKKQRQWGTEGNERMEIEERGQQNLQLETKSKGGWIMHRCD